MELGHTVLQLFQYGENEFEHVNNLLKWMNPAKNAVILDVGCGIGAVAELMSKPRPDLTFILLNNSPYQLSLCPPTMAKLLGDMHAVPMDSGLVDIVFVAYTLGYADLNKAMAEFSRLLKPGGRVVIYDMEGYNPSLRDTLNYNTFTSDQMYQTAKTYGMLLTDAVYPDASLSRVQDVFDLDPDTAPLIRAALVGLTPVMWNIKKT